MPPFYFFTLIMALGCWVTRGILSEMYTLSLHVLLYLVLVLSLSKDTD